MDNWDDKRAERLKEIKEFVLMQDVYMTAFFQDNIEGVQLVLRTILEKNDIIVEEVTAQDGITNLHGRGVRLDVFARDSQGKRYDIEVQCEDRGASFRRARYNSSLMDASITEPGENYDELPEVYVIFITENDVVGEDLPIYHIERIVTETGKEVKDGSHIIYVSSKKINDTPLGKLMADFWNPDPETMNYPELAARAKMLKGTEEGAEKMSSITKKWLEEGREEGMKKGMERGRAEGREEGRAEGMEKGRVAGFISVALGMIKKSMPVRLIQELTKLPLEKLQELSKECGVALVM